MDHGDGVDGRRVALDFSRAKREIPFASRTPTIRATLLKSQVERSTRGTSANCKSLYSLLHLSASAPGINGQLVCTRCFSCGSLQHVIARRRHLIAVTVRFHG